MGYIVLKPVKYKGLNIMPYGRIKYAVNEQNTQVVVVYSWYIDKNAFKLDAQNNMIEINALPQNVGIVYDSAKDGNNTLSFAINEAVNYVLHFHNTYVVQQGGTDFWTAEDITIEPLT